MINLNYITNGNVGARVLVWNILLNYRYAQFSSAQLSKEQIKHKRKIVNVQLNSAQQTKTLHFTPNLGAANKKRSIYDEFKRYFPDLSTESWQCKLARSPFTIDVDIRYFQMKCRRKRLNWSVTQAPKNSF